MLLAGAPAVAPLRANARAAQPRRSSLAAHAAASRKPKPPAPRPQGSPGAGRPMQKAPKPPAPAPVANPYPPPPARGPAGPPEQRAAPLPSPLAPPEAEAPTPSSEALPQVVSDRILGRIVTFSGIPLLLGFASGPAAYMYKLSGKGELSANLLYGSGTAIFVLAAVGISYGVLSASWDPRRAGSALGVDEFKNNLPALMDRIFKRSNVDV